MQATAKVLLLLPLGISEPHKTGSGLLHYFALCYEHVTKLEEWKMDYLVLGLQTCDTIHWYMRLQQMKRSWTVDFQCLDRASPRVGQRGAMERTERLHRFGRHLHRLSILTWLAHLSTNGDATIYAGKCREKWRKWWLKNFGEESSWSDPKMWDPKNLQNSAERKRQMHFFLRAWKADAFEAALALGSVPGRLRMCSAGWAHSLSQLCV